MSKEKEPIILGFDPGQDKCGLAVVGRDGQLHQHQVVASPAAVATLVDWSRQYPVEVIVMGNQTTAKCWRERLARHLPLSVPIVMVDERYSSLEARDRYWQMYPPQGLTRLIPKGMRLPPGPIDDIVAILLIERYLQG